MFIGWAVVKQTKRVREWSENGCHFQLRNNYAGTGTYHVKVPHPFQGWSLHKDSQTDDPDKARAFAAEELELNRLLMSLIDEAEVEKALAARLRDIERVCGYNLEREQLRNRVFETWRHTLESFGIDPLNTVQVVPVKFSKSKRSRWGDTPRPVAYWTSRKNAAEIITNGHQQREFDDFGTYSDTTYYGRGYATCDELSSWGNKRLKGVMDTTWALAVARKDINRLAKVFLSGSSVEYSFQFWLPDGDERQSYRRVRLDHELHRIVMNAADCMGGGADYHSNTTRVFPTVGEHGAGYRSHDHRVSYGHKNYNVRVESLDELIEFFAVQHARIIAQHVVLLFVDEQNADPDLEGKSASEAEAKPEAESSESIRDMLREQIKQEMFDFQRQQLKPRQIRAMAKRVAKAPPKSAEPAPPPPPRVVRRRGAEDRVQPLAKTYTYLENLKAQKAAESAETKKPEDS